MQKALNSLFKFESEWKTPSGNAYFSLEEEPRVITLDDSWVFSRDKSHRKCKDFPFQDIHTTGTKPVFYGVLFHYREIPRCLDIVLLFFSYVNSYLILFSF